MYCLVPEGDIEFSGTVVTDGCECLCWGWESNLGPLQEQRLLLASEPPYNAIFLRQFLCVALAALAWSVDQVGFDF